MKKKLPRENSSSGPGPGPGGQPGGQTVLPPPTSNQSSGSRGSNPLQQRFGSNPPPDILNPGVSHAPAPGSMPGPGGQSDPNMTMTMTTTSVTSGPSMSGGRVNPGMEHSDSDSLQDPGRRSGNNNNNNNNQDPSRSNSLMSETSSQPDIHPFFKVRNRFFWIAYFQTGLKC